ncbi:hypothetical protein BDR06DRAFT_977879, partial [Suillus hirtellus]
MFNPYDRGGGGQGSHSDSIPPHFTLGDDGKFDIDTLYGQAGRQMLTDALSAYYRACKDHMTCDPAGVNALNTICSSMHSVCAGPSVMEPLSSSQPQDITPTKEVHQQIICKVKHGVVGWLFTKYAMSQTAADQKCLIKKAILDAVPIKKCFLVELAGKWVRSEGQL